MRIIIILFLLTFNAYAEDIISYDTVSKQVTGYRKSVDTGKYLIDPNDLSTIKEGYLIANNLILPSVERKYWKEKNGQIVEMSQAEKDAIDAPALVALQAKNDLVSSIKTKLKTINLTDEEINYILNY